MADDLTRGTYAGKETFLYVNMGSHATPDWQEAKRVRNVTRELGPELSQVDMHGAKFSPSIPGYQRFTGSFEYVLKRGEDLIYAKLAEKREAGEPIEIRHLDNKDDVIGAKGWEAPVLLGAFSKTANGGDDVAETIPFELAEAYDGADAEVSYQDVEITV